MSVFKKFYKEIPKTDAGLAADWKGAVWKCLVPSEFADGIKGPCGDVIRCKDFTTTALRNHVRHHHPEALESVEGPAVKQGAQSTLVQMLGCASPPTSAAESWPSVGSRSAPRSKRRKENGRRTSLRSCWQSFRGARSERHFDSSAPAAALQGSVTVMWRSCCCQICHTG